MWHGENHGASLAWLGRSQRLGGVAMPLWLVNVVVEVPLKV